MVARLGVGDRLTSADVTEHRTRAAITRGLPLYVPRWSTVPLVIVSITSARPPNAPIGSPPPIDLGEAHQIGLHAEAASGAAVSGSDARSSPRRR